MLIDDDDASAYDIERLARSELLFYDEASLSIHDGKMMAW